MEVIIGILNHHGPPKAVVSDAGSNVNSAEFKGLLEKFGVAHEPSSVGNLAGNGRVERAIRTLQNKIRKAKLNMPRDILKLQNMYNYSYNNIVFLIWQLILNIITEDKK